jgi:hypothetical protein
MKNHSGDSEGEGVGGKGGGGPKISALLKCQQHLDPRTQTIFELSFEVTCLILDGSTAFSLSCFVSTPTTCVT